MVNRSLPKRIHLFNIVFDVIRVGFLFRYIFLILLISSCSNIDPSFETLSSKRPKDNINPPVTSNFSLDNLDFTVGTTKGETRTSRGYKVEAMMGSFNHEIVYQSHSRGYKLYSSSQGVQFSYPSGVTQ